MAHPQAPRLEVDVAELQRQASEIRSPERQSTAISARLRIPVGALLEQARMSAIASGSVRTSGGRRRGLEDELVDGLCFDGRSATATGAYGHENVHNRDHMRRSGRS